MYYNKSTGAEIAPTASPRPLRMNAKASWLDSTVTVFCAILFGVAFIATVDGSLDTLTERDCNAGNQRACEQLQK